MGYPWEIIVIIRFRNEATKEKEGQSNRSIYLSVLYLCFGLPHSLSSLARSIPLVALSVCPLPPTLHLRVNATTRIGVEAAGRVRATHKETATLGTHITVHCNLKASSSVAVFDHKLLWMGLFFTTRRHNARLHLCATTGTRSARALFGSILC